MPFSLDTRLYLRDLIVHVRQSICIAGLETNLVLEVDKGGTSDNGGGSTAVDAENASLLCVLTVREPFLLQIGEDFQRDLAQVVFTRAMVVFTQRQFYSCYGCFCRFVCIWF
jgi:hypothetical protein